MRQRTFGKLILRVLLFTALALVAVGCGSGDYSGQSSVSVHGYYGYHDPMYYGYGAPIYGAPVPPPPPGMRPPPGGMPPGGRPSAPPPHVSQLPSRPMPAPAPRPMPARGGGGRR